MRDITSNIWGIYFIGKCNSFFNADVESILRSLVLAVVKFETLILSRLCGCSGLFYSACKYESWFLWMDCKIRQHWSSKWGLSFDWEMSLVNWKVDEWGMHVYSLHNFVGDEPDPPRPIIFEVKTFKIIFIYFCLKRYIRWVSWESIRYTEIGLGDCGERFNFCKKYGILPSEDFKDYEEVFTW